MTILPCRSMLLGGKLVEVFEAAVVRVDHFGGDVARTRGAVEGHHYAGIVRGGIALDMFGRGAAHQQMAGCRPRPQRARLWAD